MAKLPVYVGREPEPGLTVIGRARVNWRRPPEDPDEGCPGAWRVCRFVRSLYPFLRRRDDHGGRVSNAMYDRCEDELVLALVHHYEDEHERCLTALHRALAAARPTHGEGGTA